MPDKCPEDCPEDTWWKEEDSVGEGENGAPEVIVPPGCAKTKRKRRDLLPGDISFLIGEDILGECFRIS